jgi:hypothetical protein
MNRHLFREVAKVCFGLVLADIISVFFFSANGLMPLSLLGVTWTSAMLPEVFIFDVALLVLLAHYAWHVRMPVSSPSQRTLLNVAGLIFLIVALTHLVRLAFGWSLILGDFAVPLGVSWLGVLLAAYLSYASFHFAYKRK